MRKRGEKAKDPKKFTADKQRMLDEQHAKAAPMIKKLLEEMGGLYNKAAQDIVTRGMVVPPQWVEELKVSKKRRKTTTTHTTTHTHTHTHIYMHTHTRLLLL